MSPGPTDKEQRQLPREGQQASTSPCTARVFIVRGHGHAHLITPRLFLLLLIFAPSLLLLQIRPFSWCSLVLKTIFSFHNRHTCAFPHNKLSYTSQVIGKHNFGATCTFLLTEVEHRFAWMLPGYELPYLIYIFPGATDQRLAKFVTVYTDLVEKQEVCSQTV